MRRLTTLTIVFALLVGVAGCGSSKPKSVSSPSTAATIASIQSPLSRCVQAWNANITSPSGHEIAQADAREGDTGAYMFLFSGGQCGLQIGKLAEAVWADIANTGHFEPWLRNVNGTPAVSTALVESLAREAESQPNVTLEDNGDISALSGAQAPQINLTVDLSKEAFTEVGTTGPANTESYNINESAWDQLSVERKLDLLVQFASHGGCSIQAARAVATAIRGGTFMIEENDVSNTLTHACTHPNSIRTSRFEPPRAGATLVGMLTSTELSRYNRLLAFPPGETHQPSPTKLTLFKYTDIINLSWSGWGSSVAVGKGEEQNKKCSPSCGAGDYVSLGAATVTLSAPVRGTCALEGQRPIPVRFYTQITLALPQEQQGGGASSGATTLRPTCKPPRFREEEPHEVPQSTTSPHEAQLAYLTANERGELSKAGFPVLLPPQIPVGWFRPTILSPPNSNSWSVNFHHQSGEKFEGGSITASKPVESECAKLEKEYVGSEYLHCNVMQARGVQVAELGSTSNEPTADFFWVKCGTGFDLTVDQNKPGTRIFVRQLIDALVPAGVGPSAKGC